MRAKNRYLNGYMKINHKKMNHMKIQTNKMICNKHQKKSEQVFIVPININKVA